MKSHAAVIGAVVLTALTVGCATELTKEEKAEYERVSLQREVSDEVMVGRHIASRLLGTFGSWDATPEARAAMEYVNLVGRGLAAQAGRPELVFKFGILNSEDVNAFACPGGYIFVTKGLLKTAANESELAGALAHEIAHVNEKHMYNEIAPKREVSTNEALVRFMSQGKSDIGGNLSQMIESGMKVLLEKGYGQEKEYAADRAGVLYASSAGYDATSLVDLVSKIGVIEAKKATKLSKTHPPFNVRLDTLRKFLADNGLKKGMTANSQVLDSRFTKALKKGTL